MENILFREKTNFSVGGNKFKKQGRSKSRDNTSYEQIVITILFLNSHELVATE